MSSGEIEEDGYREINHMFADATQPPEADRSGEFYAAGVKAGILEGLRIAAKLPTEDEIGLALIEARSQKRLPADIWAAEVAHIREMEAKYPEYITSFSLGCDALRQARAMLAIFAIEARGKEMGG